MSDLIETVARAIAHEQRRAFVVRATSALTADPPSTFGIALVKIVSEEIIQAIAFGDISGPPRIVVRWNPLSRDSSDLEPFADRRP